MQPTTSQRALANSIPPMSQKPPIECAKCKERMRSTEEHNLLFGVIDMAFENNWPSDHKFKPRDAEHLRAWLLIEAGHYKTLSIDDADMVAGIPSIVKMFRFFTDEVDDFRLIKTPTGVEVRRAKSIRGKLPVKEFRVVADKVYEIIKEVSGITPEFYKQNKDKAA
jgi:hypothetical protein